MGTVPAARTKHPELSSVHAETAARPNGKTLLSSASITPAAGHVPPPPPGRPTDFINTCALPARSRFWMTMSPLLSPSGTIATGTWLPSRFVTVSARTSVGASGPVSDPLTKAPSVSVPTSELTNALQAMTADLGPSAAIKGGVVRLPVVPICTPPLGQPTPGWPSESTKVRYVCPPSAPRLSRQMTRCPLPPNLASDAPSRSPVVVAISAPHGRGSAPTCAGRPISKHARYAARFMSPVPRELSRDIRAQLRHPADVYAPAEHSPTPALSRPVHHHGAPGT